MDVERPRQRRPRALDGPVAPPVEVIAGWHAGAERPVHVLRPQFDPVQVDADLGRIAGTLRAVGGLTTAEIALAAKRACRRAFDIRPVIVPVGLFGFATYTRRVSGSAVSSAKKVRSSPTSAGWTWAFSCSR